MKNRFKLFILLTALAILFSTFNIAFAQKTLPEQQNKTNAGTLLPSKEENKNVLGKFFVTMLWVLGSCGVIYVLLVAYKRGKEGSNATAQTNPDMSLNLDSPQNADDAIELVIKKF